MNSISFSETLSNTLDMVSEWPKKHSYEPSIPTNLLFFTIDTNILPHLRLNYILSTNGPFLSTARTHIIYNENPYAGKWAAGCPKHADTPKGEGKHAA